jgi:hypothetical protein
LVPDRLDPIFGVHAERVRPSFPSDYYPFSSISGQDVGGTVDITLAYLTNNHSVAIQYV